MQPKRREQLFEAQRRRALGSSLAAGDRCYVHIHNAAPLVCGLCARLDRALARIGDGADLSIA